MDIFQTSVAAIQVIYQTTVFIKEVVLEYKGYDKSKNDITDQLEHELIFIETFQHVCFRKDDPLLKNADISDSIKRDVDYSLAALEKTLAEYRVEALKYALESDQQGMLDGIIDLNVNQHGSDSKRSLKDHFKSQIKKVRESGITLRWALFGKENILELLKVYREWTNRLRETFQLITGVCTLTSLRHPVAENLGIARARERQERASQPPPTDYGPLEGTAKDLRKQSENDCLSMCVYESDDGFDPKDVIVDIRPYDEALLRANEGKNLDEIKSLKKPLRDLSWFLQCLNQPPSTGCDIECDYGLHTLNCIGYLDQPESDRGLLLYHLPTDRISDEDILSLHALINKDATKFKPGIGGRFRVAHALAATILATHSSGWVHKNICSRGILALPSQISLNEIDPYVLGWGTSRPVNADTNLVGMFEFEPNLHHHKDRFGQPNRKFAREHDVYSLGVVLLEIGLWKTMSTIFAKQIQRQPKVDVKNQASTFQKVNGYIMDKTQSLELRQEMGAAYAEVIKTCLTWPSAGSESDACDLAITFRKTVVDALVLGSRL
jgi:hypothetical protein